LDQSTARPAFTQSEAKRCPVEGALLLATLDVLAWLLLGQKLGRIDAGLGWGSGADREEILLYG